MEMDLIIILVDGAGKSMKSLLKVSPGFLVPLTSLRLGGNTMQALINKELKLTYLQA